MVCDTIEQVNAAVCTSKVRGGSIIFPTIPLLAMDWMPQALQARSTLDRGSVSFAQSVEQTDGTESNCQRPHASAAKVELWVKPRSADWVRLRRVALSWRIAFLSSSNLIKTTAGPHSRADRPAKAPNAHPATHHPSRSASFTPSDTRPHCAARPPAQPARAPFATSVVLHARCTPSSASLRRKRRLPPSPCPPPTAPRPRRPSRPRPCRPLHPPRPHLRSGNALKAMLASPMARRRNRLQSWTTAQTCLCRLRSKTLCPS